MGLDEMKDKAQELAGQHGDKAEQGVDKGAEFAKDKFGHEEQVDSASDKARDFLGNSDEQNQG